MVLEAGEDVMYAERALREIEVMKQKGVEGSENLEGLSLHVLRVWDVD